MKLTRETALRFHYVFDQLLPPFVRDCRWLMAIPMRLLFRHRADIYLDFKETAYRMSEEEFCRVYENVAEVDIERDTNLNRASIDKILAHVRGPNVLEVGCGKGYLLGLLAKRFQMSACDIVVSPELVAVHPGVRFQQANVEALPFSDKQFDTVVCTHTLEHVRNLSKAVAELRRVARQVILVVPRQRPYRYTFDLHLNFFPYHYSLIAALGKGGTEVICENAGGDIFYVENVA